MRTIALGLCALFGSVAVAPDPHPDAVSSPVELTASDVQVTFYLSAAGLLEEGSFERVDAEASFVGDRLETLDVTVHIDSLKTAIPKLREHLLSSEVLDGARYPTASFHLVSVDETDAPRRTHELAGELRIRDVQRVVKVPITAHATEQSFSGHTSIHLSPADYGIRAIRWTDPEVELYLSFRFAR